MNTEDRELILSKILSGSANDNEHIKWCVDLSVNDPDDLIRPYARSWLEQNVVKISKRLLEQEQFEIEKEVSPPL